MRHAGFTLLELLIVIAIIALLIAISVPALQSSRRQTQAVVCASNIRQLTAGLFMYEAENETLPFGFNLSFVPPPGGYPGNPAYDKLGWWWFNYISDYSKRDGDKKRILWCPSRRIDNTRLKGYVLHGNYGVNQSICKSWLGGGTQTEFIGTPLKTSDIVRPTHTLLLIDSGYALINWRHAIDPSDVTLGPRIEDTAYIPGLKVNKKRNLWTGQEQDAIYGRHKGKTVNIGFADGHVSREKADFLLVEKIGDSYKNCLHVWVPR